MTDIGTFLRNSKKGGIKYDRYWKDEGRTEAVLNEITHYITRLSVSPRSLALVTVSPNSESVKSSDADDQPSAAKPIRAKSMPFENENKVNLCILTAVSESELQIIEYEKKRERLVQEKVQRKKDEIDSRLFDLQQQAEQQFQLLRRRCELEVMRKNAELQHLQEMSLKEAQEKELREKEMHSTHAKRISARMREAEIRQRQAEEDMQKREKEQMEMKQHLIACQRELHACIQQTKEKLDMCGHKLHLQVTSDERHNRMDEILKKIDKIVEESTYKEVHMEELKTAQTLLDDAQMIYQRVTTDTEQARNKALLESELHKAKSVTAESTCSSQTSLNTCASPISTKTETRRRLNFDDSSYGAGSQFSGSAQLYSKRLFDSEEDKSMELTETGENSNRTSFVENLHSVSPTTSGQFIGDSNSTFASENEKISLTETPSAQSKTISSEEGENVSAFLKCVAPDAFKEYTKLLGILDHWVDTCKPFASNPKNKSFSFFRAVGTPINAISRNSGAHLKDKLDKILVLLAGGTSDIFGGTPHPLAIKFCKDLVARQFVSQGEGQVSSHNSHAFPFATVMVGVWSHHTDVGTLMLSYFYKKCPYLVPYYPPRLEGQSDEDYYKSQGYLYTDGSVESKEKFLKRMSGLMRLYAAVIQSPLPPGCKGPHPHDISWGWKWLARILSLEPRADITATLLLDFLEMLGHSLQKTYGKQFQKLLHALCKDYFKKIENITPSCSLGPTSRLKAFLQAAIKNRRIDLPEGVLTPDFFKT